MPSFYVAFPFFLLLYIALFLPYHCLCREVFLCPAPLLAFFGVGVSAHLIMHCFCLYVSGRSNVGKSSLLRSLCVKNLPDVETDDRPGTTRTIDFYEIRKLMRIVDLPGYGMLLSFHL